MIRRTFLAAFACLPATFARAGRSDGALHAALRHHLPPGLDPHALGATLRATHPPCTTADCLARAALATPADLPARSAADFAAGRTLTVEGWILSHTEAWACAALA